MKHKMFSVYMAFSSSCSFNTCVTTVALFPSLQIQVKTFLKYFMTDIH